MEKLIRKYKSQFKIFQQQKADFNRLWNIDDKTAKLLYMLIINKAPKRMLEIGTSNGYSTFWLSLAAEHSKAKVLTIEAFPDRYEMAKKNLKNRNNVTQYLGKAENIIPTLSGKFDFVFIDAGKIGYINYIKLLLHKLDDNALVIADNVISHASTVQEYLDFVRYSPKFTSVVVDVGTGLEISVFHK